MYYYFKSLSLNSNDIYILKIYYRLARIEAKTFLRNM